MEGETCKEVKLISMLSGKEADGGCLCVFERDQTSTFG